MDPRNPELFDKVLVSTLKAGDVYHERIIQFNALNARVVPGLVLYLINTCIPMAQPIKTV
ncbi:MAG: hypothetical protein WBV94_03375 [Blastocatellia bacterium]